MTTKEVSWLVEDMYYFFADGANDMDRFYVRVSNNSEPYLVTQRHDHDGAIYLTLREYLELDGHEQ